ncbi:MAG: glycosyltransferase family 2 protein [Mariprofundales bacterium]|nr:glycosyltransferase family 2 protein [Mariprofundales bacterium]
MRQIRISVVVPLYGEEESVARLVHEVDAALAGEVYELILVNDGSADATASVINTMCQEFSAVTGIHFQRNYGQTAALQAGLVAARGEFVVYMDGDLQTDPCDILPMVEKLEAEGLDMVNGWRKQRQDARLTRNFPSMVANGMIKFFTGLALHDNGCPMKVMRQWVAKGLHLYGEQHRFIAALAAINGAKVGEMVVHHRARQFGVSKYGLGRTFRVLVDLLLVLFFQRFTDRPLQLFGTGGLFAFAIGFAIDGWLTADKLLLGAELAGRPMLLLGSLLLLSGMLLFGIGLVLEVQMRTYYESTGQQVYRIKSRSGECVSRVDIKEN